MTVEKDVTSPSTNITLSGNDVTLEYSNLQLTENLLKLKQ